MGQTDAALGPELKTLQCFKSTIQIVPYYITRDHLLPITWFH